MQEIWRTVKDYPLYSVSNLGRLKNNKTQKILKGGLDIYGYRIAILCNNGKRKSKTIHRLIAEAFIDNPDNKPQVNHINGDKSDNRLENLEWMTAGENTRDANRHGKGHQMNQNGEKNSMSSLTEQQVIEIIKETKKPNRRKDQKIADEYGVTRKTISNIRHNLTWKHIDRNSIS